MKLHLNTNGTRNIFTAHGAGHVMVSGQRYEHPIVVTPEQVYTDWQPQSFDALEAEHFAYFLVLHPEVVLFGTGIKLRFPHPRLYQALSVAGIGVEFMDTAAACRTYNILMNEDRKVAVGILF